MSINIMNYSKGELAIVQLLDLLFSDSSLFTPDATSKQFLLPRIFDAIRPKDTTTAIYHIIGYILVSCKEHK